MTNVKLEFPKHFEFKGGIGGAIVFEVSDEGGLFGKGGASSVVEYSYKPNWRAKRGGKYFFQTSEGGILPAIDERTSLDESRWKLGNYSKYELVIDDNIEKQEAIMRVKRYCWDEFGPFEPNWDDEKEEKWFPVWDHMNQKFGGTVTYSYVYPLDVDYLCSNQHVDQLIKDCEDDLKIIFNIQHD